MPETLRNGLAVDGEHIVDAVYSSGASLINNLQKKQKQKNKGVEMLFKDTSFKNQPLQLDGNEYLSCSFESCSLTFRGEESTTLDSCSFVDVDFNFEGPAKATLDFLESLYQAGLESMVDEIVNNIRSGPTMTSRT